MSAEIYMHPGDSATYLVKCNIRSLSAARRADMTGLVPSKLKIGRRPSHPRVNREDQDNYTEAPLDTFGNFWKCGTAPRSSVRRAKSSADGSVGQVVCAEIELEQP